MTKIGLMILLAHLKFCWRILNFAGAVFEVQVAPANNLRQQNFAGAAPENTDTGSRKEVGVNPPLPNLRYRTTYVSGDLFLAAGGPVELCRLWYKI